MNLVKLITDQLSSDAITRLSTLLGVDGATVESAVEAAVPSLLAGLSGLSAQDDGLRKLTGALNGLGEGAFGNFDRMLGGDTGAIFDKGSLLLGSLFGGGLTGNLATAVSRFTGLESGTVKSLLAYLAPLVLGRVASQWQNQGGTPAALKSLMADQKRYIADALPAGFSLEDVPGLARIGDAARTATQAAKSAGSESRSLASTLLPLALLLGAVFLAWGFWNNRPQAPQAGVDEAVDVTEEVVAMKPVLPESADMPEVTRMKDELAGLFTSLGTALAGIQDAASAEAALPQLEELNRKIDAMKATLENLPETGRTALASFVKEQIDPLKAEATKALSTSGLGERIKSLIQEIVRKLEELHIIEPTP